MAGLKTKMRLSLLVAAMLVSFSCFSQSDSSGSSEQSSEQIMKDHILIAEPPSPEEDFYKGSIEGGAGTIVPITNRALRLSLGGVYSLHISGNFVIVPHIFAGLELEDDELGSSSDLGYNTSMFIYNAGVKIGYYTYMQQDFLFCYSLSFGPSLLAYTNAAIPAPKGGFRAQTFFITPNVFIGYRINDELRVGADFSILCMGYQFNPSTIGIQDLLPASYNPAKDNNAITTCFEGGFGLYWAFDEGKRK